MTPTQNPPELAAHLAPETPSSAHVCPKCGSDSIRESSTRRGMDLLPANIGKIAYRCRGCRTRFYLKRQNANSTPSSSTTPRRRTSEGKRQPLWKHPILKRNGNEISIALGSLVAFAVFLYLLVRSSAAL